MFSTFKSAIQMALAPCAAKRRTVAAPMPEAPPVTLKTRELSDTFNFGLDIVLDGDSYSL